MVLPHPSYALLQTQLNSATRNERIDIEEDMDKDLQPLISSFQEHIDHLSNNDFQRVFLTPFVLLG